MRFVPSISPATTSPATRQVRALSAAHAVKPVHPLDQPVPYAENNATHQQAAHPVERQEQRSELLEDRRKICRRVKHQHVLIELRSGIDRRRHNLRAGDMAEHIDEKA
ncbi:MAG: hypothetical protein EPO42_02065 [Gallionellaceae bacterium]|nr:MAG: hypothetical protein EPO42_02065 [Gallionellaceae bacterium]